MGYVLKTYENLVATPSAAGPHSRKRAVWWWLCRASSSALLGLLVVGYFECFGFPVKHAEASWLLEFDFMVFPLIAVTLDTDIAIFRFPKPINWQPWCLI